MMFAHKFAASLPMKMARPWKEDPDVAAKSQAPKPKKVPKNWHAGPDSAFGQAKTIGALKLIGLILNILTKVSIHINLCAHRNNKMYYNFLRVCVLHCFSLGVSSL